jgi:four helix bundle protein
MNKPLVLEDRLLEFAAIATDIVEKLPNSRLGNHLAGQLVRSATSPLLNYGEAQVAESRADFIHKMKISLKELKETFANLKLIKRKSMIVDIVFLDKVLSENQQLVSIFVKSVLTASESLKKNNQ